MLSHVPVNHKVLESFLRLCVAKFEQKDGVSWGLDAFNLRPSQFELRKLNHTLLNDLRRRLLFTGIVGHTELQQLKVVVSEANLKTGSQLLLLGEIFGKNMQGSVEHVFGLGKVLFGDKVVSQVHAVHTEVFMLVLVERQLSLHCLCAVHDTLLDFACFGVHLSIVEVSLSQVRLKLTHVRSFASNKLPAFFRGRVIEKIGIDWLQLVVLICLHCVGIFVNLMRFVKVA